LPAANPRCDSFGFGQSPLSSAMFRLRAAATPILFVVFKFAFRDLLLSLFLKTRIQQSFMALSPIIMRMYLD